MVDAADIIEGKKREDEFKLKLIYNAARIAGNTAKGDKYTFDWDDKKKRREISAGVKELIKQQDIIDKKLGKM